MATKPLVLKSVLLRMSTSCRSSSRQADVKCSFLNFLLDVSNYNIFLELLLHMRRRKLYYLSSTPSTAFENSNQVV